MQNQGLSKGLLVFTLLMLPLFWLSGCSHFLGKQPQSHRSKTFSAEAYVEDLALAQLAFAGPVDDRKSQAARARALNESGTHKGAHKKISPLTVLNISYSLEQDDKKKHVLVPVSITEEMPAFSSLQVVQEDLSKLKYTLENIQAQRVTVTLPVKEPFSEKDGSLLRKQVQEALKQIDVTATPISAYENARLQLQLVEFFMKYGVRDAAYMSLENAKDGLAYMAEKTPNTDTTTLSQQSDVLAARLSKEMPFGF